MHLGQQNDDVQMRDYNNYKLMYTLNIYICEIVMAYGC